MNSNINIGDFFTLQNTIESISDSDYSKTGLIIEAAKAFERTTYQCVYIIDYFKQGFLYVSNNIARLCGGEAEKIKDFGYKFYIDYVPKEDLKMLVEINTKGFKLFNTLPIGERKKYTISYDFHIMRDKRKRLVNHKLTPLVLTKDGRIWLAICTISLAATNEPGNVIMKKVGASTFYQYSLYDHKWEERKEIVLTDNEREVLSLSTQGYTMNDIADNICKSVDTVKACKRSIFQKMDVKNIAEALTYAQNHQLI
ncbi:MAG: helix-turn-helix transcriptional regulator [Bacteroidales bacterium 43_36]|nr:MAG: helix-turn-helix transcriptional regulator [Bacteroidales bacterium 43_36]